MKLSILALVAAFQVLTIQSFAQSQIQVKPCKQNCIEIAALPVMEKAVLASNPAFVQDPSCPTPGSETIKNAITGTGKAMTSAKIIKDMVAQSTTKRDLIMSDRSRCGACKQINLVSTFTTSAPNQLKLDSSCPTPFASNFQKELNNQDIEAFANDTIRGRNAQGQQFANACSNACNLYTATASTPLSSATSRLNLTILCGQPRVGSILSATYDLSVGFVHQWVCAK